jgi:outer membrane cobalamin receptor
MLSLGLVLKTFSIQAHGVVPGQAPETATLPAVIVTAPRFVPDSVTETSSATVLNRADLAVSEERDLNGVLRGLPGVTLHKAGSGTTLSSLFVRGASSGLGQITLDGIPLFSSLTGSFNLATLPADALERVEVVRGASAALGGVIRMFTRDSLDDQAFLHVDGGSFGTLSETAGASLTGKHARVTATLSRDDVFEGISEADSANGNPERDNFQSTLGVLRFAATPSTTLDLDGSLLYRRYRAEIDIPGLLPGGRVGLMDDRNGLVYEEAWMAQTTATAHIAQGWSSSLQLGFTRNRTSGRVTPGLFSFDNRLLLANWSNRHTLYRSPPRPSATAKRGEPLPLETRLQFTWGGEARHEQGENAFDLPGLLLHGDRAVYAGFAELEGESGPWGAYVGGRVDHYEDFGTHPTVRFGVSRWLISTLKLRGSGGYGYRAPSFHERFFVPLFGNPHLEPEQGWSGDVGFDWAPANGTRVSATGFYSRVDDLIQLSFTPRSFSLFVSENVPDARLWGVEVEGNHAWSETVSVGIHYTYTDTRDLETGRVLPRRPAHQGRVFGEWRVSVVPVTLYVEVVYRGRHFDDSANTVGLGDAVYLNAQASYRISSHVLAYVRGENLNDDRTPEMFSFGARGAGVFGGVRVGF